MRRIDEEEEKSKIAELKEGKRTNHSTASAPLTVTHNREAGDGRKIKDKGTGKRSTEEKEKKENKDGLERRRENQHASLPLEVRDNDRREWKTK